MVYAYFNLYMFSLLTLSHILLLFFQISNAMRVRDLIFLPADKDIRDITLW